MTTEVEKLPGPGDVLDLRAAHLNFKIGNGAPSIIRTAEEVRTFGLYSAILRDGRIRILSAAESGCDAGRWIEMREMTVESARRLRDTLNEFLASREMSSV